jgi:hypothetical protein
MAEWDDMDTQTEEYQTDERPRRRMPDPLNLIVGLITLGVASYALTDGQWGLPAVDPRWVVAGGALLVGLLLLGASLRPGRRR